MRGKISTFDFFEILTVIITFIVIIFTTALILAIVLKGIPYLGVAFYSEEVRFSIRLSLYTASIATLICMLLAIPTAYALTRTVFPLILVCFPI